MIQELLRRIDSFPARWASRYNNALAALRDRRRLISERENRGGEFLFGLQLAKSTSARSDSEVNA